MSADFGEQLTFSGIPEPKKPRAKRPVGAVEYAEELPFARVVVERLPAHLDRLFDYRVPKKFDEVAVVGAKVKVPFGGQMLDGYVVERAEDTEHQGRISALKSMVSGVPLVSPDALDLYRRIADYYAGSLGDVLRLAVPPRHAGAEKSFLAQVASSAIAGEAIAPADQGASAAEEAASAHDTAVAGDSDSNGSGPTDTYADPEAAELSPHKPTSPGAGETGTLEAAAPETPAWDMYSAGPALVSHVLAGSGPRAVWTALPGTGSVPTSSALRTKAQVTSSGPGVEAGASQDADLLPHWTLALAQLARGMETSNKSVVIVVPVAKDVTRVAAALRAVGVDQFSWDNAEAWSFVTLTHELSAAARFENYLLATQGKAKVVVGTRAAALTPVPELGLVVCWDDGDSSHQEKHAPYPHTREIAALRAEQSGSALLIGALDRTVHAQSLLASGWAQDVSAERSVVRQAAPLVTAFGEMEIQRDSGGAQARLPGAVWRDITAALKRGPVLIQVPRAGYVPYVACARCREAARCATCNGPLGLGSAGAPPHCTWCGSLAGDWACASCGFGSVRAIRIGSDRTAEELGRAFPGTTVRTSGAQSKGGVLESVPAKSALVIATPGAEPYVQGGYAMGVLLDAHLSSGGSGLYANQEALARWMRAASLVTSRERGGKVTLVGQGAALPTATFVRWDPQGMATRELDERAALKMPPVWRVASVTGDRLTVTQFLDDIALPSSAEVLGPVELAPEDFPPGSHPSLDRVVRAIIRVPLRQGRELARAIKAMTHIASAKRTSTRVDVVLDPKELA